MKKKIHHIIYLVALVILAGSIPVSNFGMSIGGLLLSLNWILEWNWKEKWNRLIENKLAIILSSFFFIFLIGLIHTNDWHTATDNILSKLPLLYAPLIFATSKKLNGKEIQLIVAIFIAVTFVSTLISIIYLLTHFVENIRNISLFISHIRFSFCILMSIIFSFQFSIKVKNSPYWLRTLFFILTLWFIIYLFISQTFTGIILLFIITLFYFLYIIFKEKKTFIRKILLITIFGSLGLFILYLFTVTWNYYQVSLPLTLPQKTASGNLYTHDFNSIIENGSYTELYLCEEELRTTWEERSDTPYDSVRPCLIRYLNSKKLYKDKEGVKALTVSDINNIENKIANIAYTQIFGVKKALYPTFFGISLYKRYGSTNHSSLLQRLTLWKVSCSIIENNFWSGIGIGDHKIEINRQLSLENSSLRKNMGAHNQFLTFQLMGGIFVLVAFFIQLFSPFIMTKRAHTLNYVFFFIIIFSSFFFEDTLETQAGITFYAILNSFLLFCFDINAVLDSFSNKKSV